MLRLPLGLSEEAGQFGGILLGAKLGAPITEAVLLALRDWVAYVMDSTGSGAEGRCSTAHGPRSPGLFEAQGLRVD